MEQPEQKVEGEFVGLLATLLTAVGHFMPTVRHFMQQYAVAADQTISGVTDGLSWVVHLASKRFLFSLIRYRGSVS